MAATPIVMRAMRSKSENAWSVFDRAVELIAEMDGLVSIMDGITELPEGPVIGAIFTISKKSRRRDTF